MIIKNTNFAIDTNAIELKSINKHSICLPYHGTLPAGFDNAESAWLHFNVQLVQSCSPVKVALCIKSGNGKPIRKPVHADKQEVVDILMKFFESKTGLSAYYEGLWAGHFIDWHKIASQPMRITEIFAQMSAEDRSTALKWMTSFNNSH